MIDDVRIESDEDGFRLILVGDLEDETGAYFCDPEATELRLRLPADVAAGLLDAARVEIGPWRNERDQAEADWRASRDLPDPADGYDLDDPKHPAWADRAADAADLARDRQQEES